MAILSINKWPHSLIMAKVRLIKLNNQLGREYSMKNKLQILVFIAVQLLILSSNSSVAQESGDNVTTDIEKEQLPAWKGDIQFGYVMSTGNT